MKIILVRHGEAAGDPHRHCEPPVEGYLTERGQQQAASIVASLCALEPTHVYSSPLGRAIQTAQPLVQACGVSMQLLDWLREWQPATQLGRCQDTQWEELERRAALLRPEMAWQSGAGESTFEFAGRVIPGVLELLASLGVEAAHGGYLVAHEAVGYRIVLVAHGGTLGRLAAFLLGIPLCPYPPLSFDHAGVAVFEMQRRVDVWYPVLRLVRPGGCE